MAAGVLAGNCMTPMKFARGGAGKYVAGVQPGFAGGAARGNGWRLWLAGDVIEVYRGLTTAQWPLPFALGAGWGIAQVLFGLSIARLGAGARVRDHHRLGSLFGTLVPLFFKNREVWPRRAAL